MNGLIVPAALGEGYLLFLSGVALVECWLGLVGIGCGRGTCYACKSLCDGPVKS